MIIGREIEQKRILEAVNSAKSEFVAIYGRRRVGKTYLIKEVFSGKYTFQHTGLAKASRREQLKEFAASVAKYSRAKVSVPRDWYEAFHLLEAYLEGATDARKVIFLDELPWMDTPKSGFISALEHFWNGWASLRDDILLIVCGSATSWIINKIIEDYGGLHNRVTKRIHLRPFTLHECEKYARSRGIVLRRAELLEYYMIAGGVPYYWEQLEKGESLAQNIDRIFFSESGELRGEFNRLYASLFRKPQDYIAMVTALGTKKVGMTRKELARFAHVPENGKLSERLSDLEQCGFIRRYSMPGKSIQDSLYQLVDNFTLFHFKFLANLSESEPAAGYWRSVANSQTVRIWCGLAFERVCLQHVEQIKAALGIQGVATRVYAWRSSSVKPAVQVDLVIDRDDKVVNLCEMKYTAGPCTITGEYEHELVEKVDAYVREVSNGKTVHLTLVSANGVRQTASAACLQRDLTASVLFEANGL